MQAVLNTSVLQQRAGIAIPAIAQGLTRRPAARDMHVQGGLETARQSRPHRVTEFSAWRSTCPAAGEAACSSAQGVGIPARRQAKESAAAPNVARRSVAALVMVDLQIDDGRATSFREQQRSAVCPRPAGHQLAQSRADLPTYLLLASSRARCPRVLRQIRRAQGALFTVDSSTQLAVAGQQHSNTAQRG
jgi:hypothetical protein